MAEEPKLLGFNVDASDGEGDRYIGDVDATLSFVREIITSEAEGMTDEVTAFFLITRCDKTQGEIDSLENVPTVNKDYAFRPVQVNRDLLEALKELIEGDAEDAITNARYVIANAERTAASACSGAPPEALRWIPIEERLPSLDIEEEDEDVSDLIHRFSDVVFVAFVPCFYDQAFASRPVPLPLDASRTLAYLAENGRWYEGDEAPKEVKRVVAWMPLPDGPQVLVGGEAPSPASSSPSASATP